MRCRAGHLLDELELPPSSEYVLEIPKTWVFWTSRPGGQGASRSTQGGVGKPTAPTRVARTVVEIAHALLRLGVDEPLQVREGAVGPLVLEFAAIRVWGILAPQAGATVLSF